ncbi:hypothetical protein CCHR01_01678 [Colletotrichum chrysophilum]|uniref:Uncharacterized protein n=1 Tax=Colletotrichum chrysophilum TaxID=1836956 RepID=A0AAD9B1J6_9PEZI|nr:hypothetical protein CCHR01_01678 [Colletotrichum chrysophilum]
MRYQVGRACAVADYNKLYDELQLLPDVSIAEEAEDKQQCLHPRCYRKQASEVRYYE